MEMFQRSLIASILVTITACLMGSFLLLRNLALIGDGLAHVSFGGIAIAIAMGSTAPLWYALFFSVISSPAKTPTSTPSRIETMRATSGTHGDR